MLPDQNALCDLHGASRTNAAGSQAQRGQLVAQPSSTRTALRAISSVKLTSKEVSALLKNVKRNHRESSVRLKEDTTSD